MKFARSKILVAVLMLVLTLIVTACSNDTSLGALEGTFEVEGVEGATLVFRGNSVIVSISYADMGMDFIPGSIELEGVFEVNEDEQTITISFTDDAILNFADALVEIIDVIVVETLLSDPQVAEIMQDPELSEAFLAAMQPYMDELAEELDELFDEMIEELEQGFVLTFGDNFDRLYHEDGAIYVRR